MRDMKRLRKLTVLVTALALAVTLLATPAVAASGPDEGDHRISLVDTPRDRLGLLLLGSMFLAGAVGLVNARRQLRGERGQASGEFRWR
jgi:hypothetical protein